jgi:hypothetical protein
MVNRRHGLTAAKDFLRHADIAITAAHYIALELGHHDSRITFAHYRELVKPKDAERYWQIKPTDRGAKVVRLFRAAGL